MKPSRLGTAGILLLGLALNAAAPPPDLRRLRAEQWLGPAVAIDVDGQPAWAAGARAVLYFEARGMEGPIQGLIRVDGLRVDGVELLVSEEGRGTGRWLDADAAAPLRGASVSAPLRWDGVTGASRSSQVILDAVNERLRRWQGRPR